MMSACVLLTAVLGLNAAPHSPGFGDARWLWPQELGSVTNTVVEFRRSFVAERETPVEMLLAADTVYAVSLNGRFVHSGRFPDVPPQRYYDVLPLGSVRTGTNVLEVSVYVQGVDSFQTIPGDPGVMFALRGKGLSVTSGEGTEWRLSAGDRRDGVAWITSQLAFSFEFDAAARESAWHAIRPDDAVRGCKAFELSRRPVPRVEVLSEIPTTVAGQGRLDGSSVPTEVAPGMDSTAMSSVPADLFFAADGKSVRKEMFGDGFYVLVDLGREEAGFLSLDVDTDAGVVIDVGHAEHAENGRIRTHIGNRNFAGRYRTGNGRQSYLRWERRMAGRYVQLHVRGVRTHFTLHRISLRPAVFPVEEREPPKVLSARQRKIWETSVRTLRLCMHEHYEDCPWREQALYGNDARNQMLCGYHAFGPDNRMPELALQVHARGLGEDGWLELCMPARIGITIPSFTLCWVLSVADNLDYRKDAAFTRRLMPTVAAILDRRLSEMREGLLPCPSGKRYWQFYEWAEGLEGDLSGETAVRSGEWRYESPLNLFFILALEAGARCAEATDDFAAAGRWREAAGKLRETVVRKFWNAAAGQVETRLDRPGRGAEFVQSLALLADAVPQSRRQDVVRKLMRRSDWTEITLSQTLYKFEALIAEGGEAALSALRVLDEEWGRMLDKGATSFWEMREGWTAFDDAGSLCHGWSSVPVYFYSKYPDLAAASAVPQRLEFDGTSLKFDGRREFLVSGEFHYFRVPKDEWRRRMRLFKDAGGNCLATYVPWCLHEPEEGRVVFGDRPERDLDGFLRLAEEEGLLVIVRPGPYQYSELLFDGLPRWLVERYPQIHTRKPDGTRLRTGSVDYNHPVFVEKACAYLTKVADVVRPHLAVRGGCVSMVQLDNELGGIHVWFGAPVSERYFRETAEFLATLRTCLAKAGIPGPYCHNVGGLDMVTDFRPAVDRMGNSDFLLGYDSYYNLSDVAKGESPDNQYFLNTLLACDVMRGYGFPPVAFELQAGSIGDSPPIRSQDLLASFMANLAAGVRGVNYYVFTGGPTPDGLGNRADVYDYQAPVAADGTCRPTYEALKTFGRFVREHPQLLETRRLSSVAFGFEWEHFSGCAPFDEAFFRNGLRYSLMQSAYQPKHIELTDLSGLDQPLVLAGLTSMSETVQRRVADFVRNGGRLLVAPDFPRIDHAGRSCTILADELGAPASEAADVDAVAEPLCRSGSMRVYGLTPVRRFTVDAGSADLLASADGRHAYACRWPCGKGCVLQLGATWKAAHFAQSDLAAKLVAELGARPVARSSDRNVFHSEMALPDGGMAVFALNLRATPSQTTVTLDDGRSVSFDLKPMEVGYHEFPPAATSVQQVFQ